MDQDNSNIPLLAHSQDCPTGRHENEKATSPIKPNEMWSFNLTRQSKWIRKTKKHSNRKKCLKMPLFSIFQHYNTLLQQ